MGSVRSWMEKNLPRRRFLLLTGSGFFAALMVRAQALAKAGYIRVQEFQIRSIEGSQKVDVKGWRLRIEGLVEKPTFLTLDEIKALPRHRLTKDFICVEGWGLKDQRWEGAHLRDIFSLVKIGPKARYVTFHATGEKYADSLSLSEALEEDTILAYHLNGKDLPPDSGFPLRLVVPRMYGYKGVKWVERVVLTETQEIGYWEHRGYSVDGSIPK